MKRILWRLTAASSGVLVALSMNIGPASASSSGDHRPERNPVQVADQSASTEQNAESSAKSVQFLPVNANVPVQILSLGHNGGRTTQSNHSTAESKATNQAGTEQSIRQEQSVWRPKAPKGHDSKGHNDRKGHDKKGHDGWKPEGPKGHDSKGHDSKGHEPKGYGGSAFQGASQEARTRQNADSYAKSVQILPVNANVPVQILSLGSNGGKTTQSNNSTAESKAANEAWTGQSLDQRQKVKGDAPKGRDSKGDKPKGYGSSAFQGAAQFASTDQNAESSAKSVQIVPINANVPVQILSLGSNGGDTTQSNNSTAKSKAANEAWTDQSLEQHQQAGPGPAFQGASQTASTDQNAVSSAKSVQVAPINANVPVQILSLGHNGGDTTQSNNSTATSSATNQAGTAQVLGQAQGVLGGLTG